MSFRARRNGRAWRNDGTVDRERRPFDVTRCQYADFTAHKTSPFPFSSNFQVLGRDLIFGRSGSQAARNFPKAEAVHTSPQPVHTCTHTRTDNTHAHAPKRQVSLVGTLLSQAANLAQDARARTHLHLLPSLPPPVPSSAHVARRGSVTVRTRGELDASVGGSCGGAVSVIALWGRAFTKKTSVWGVITVYFKV